VYAAATDVIEEKEVKLSANLLASFQDQLLLGGIPATPISLDRDELHIQEQQNSVCRPTSPQSANPTKDR
jgi:hypothetical protein